MTQHRFDSAKKNMFYFGHHKCATNWMRMVLGDICKRRQWNLKGYNGSAMSDLSFVDADTTLHCYWNSWTTDLNDLPSSFKGFHLVRDPRDTLVSAYWSWRNTHSTNNASWLLKERPMLKKLNLEEGLLYMVDRISIIEQLEGWSLSDNRNILTIQYEVLLKETADTYHKIFSFLEESITDEEVSELVSNHSFKSITGRHSGHEDVNSHFRKGVAGDWRNYFTERIKNDFKNKHGEDLIRLGYETNKNW